MTEKDVAMMEVEKEVKVHINTILYEQGYITEQMFLYAQTAFQCKKQMSMKTI